MTTTIGAKEKEPGAFTAAVAAFSCASAYAETNANPYQRHETKSVGRARNQTRRPERQKIVHGTKSVASCAQNHNPIDSPQNTPPRPLQCERFPGKKRQYRDPREAQSEIISLCAVFAPTRAPVPSGSVCERCESAYAPFMLTSSITPRERAASAVRSRARRRRPVVQHRLLLPNFTKMTNLPPGDGRAPK